MSDQDMRLRVVEVEREGPRAAMNRVMQRTIDLVQEAAPMVDVESAPSVHAFVDTVTVSVLQAASEASLPEDEWPAAIDVALRTFVFTKTTNVNLATALGRLARGETVFP
jgi:hypothetical protein